MTTDLSVEDAKLVTLARGARGRVAATGGAAVRDETGRSYTGASVKLTSLSLSAAQVAIASAVTSGARGLECVVVIGEIGSEDLALTREVGGAGVPLLVVGNDGEVLETLVS